MSPNLSIKTYQTANALDESIKALVKPYPRVLDIGCGIRPQNFYQPALHLCIEPYHEYVKLLCDRFAEVPGFMVLQGEAIANLKLLPDQSFDHVFLVDVIEHLPKEDGFALIKEMTRIVRQQIFVFTPLGFMPQEYHSQDQDAWGLGGVEFQQHRSGWLPEDFGADWVFHQCSHYHLYDAHQQLLDQPFGAFWAIYQAPKPKMSHLGFANKTLFFAEELPPLNSPEAKKWYALLQHIDYTSFGLVNIKHQLDTKAYSNFLPSQKKIPCPSSFVNIEPSLPSLKKWLKLFYCLGLKLPQLLRFVKRHGFENLVYYGSDPVPLKVIKLLAKLCRCRFVHMLSTDFPTRTEEIVAAKELTEVIASKTLNMDKS